MSVLKKFREKQQRKNFRKHTPFEFVEWLRYTNAGMLDIGNLYCYEYAIKNLPSDNPVIEIGSFCGLSTNLIAFYLRHFSKNNKIMTCDKWIFEGGEDQNALLAGSALTHGEYSQFVKDSYMRNISFFSKHNLPFTIECYSDEFFALWQKREKTHDIFGRPVELGGNISFAYIDGNHMYDFAKRDFVNTDKWLEKGGLILFDDSADFSTWEVKRVISEIKQSGRYEVVAANPNYLVRKIS